MGMEMEMCGGLKAGRRRDARATPTAQAGRTRHTHGAGGTHAPHPTAQAGRTRHIHGAGGTHAPHPTAQAGRTRHLYLK